MKEDSGLRYSPEIITKSPDEPPDALNNNHVATNRESILDSRVSLNGYGAEQTTTFKGEVYPNLYNNGHTNNVCMTDDGHISLSYQDSSSDGDRTAL